MEAVGAGRRHMSRRGHIVVLVIAVAVILLGVAGFQMLAGPPKAAKDAINRYVATHDGFAYKTDRWRESPNGRCLLVEVVPRNEGRGYTWVHLAERGSTYEVLKASTDSDHFDGDDPSWPAQCDNR